MAEIKLDELRRRIGDLTLRLWAYEAAEQAGQAEQAEQAEQEMAQIDPDAPASIEAAFKERLAQTAGMIVQPHASVGAE